MQNCRFRSRVRALTLAVALGLLGAAVIPGLTQASQTVGNFSYGQMQSTTVGASGVAPTRLASRQFTSRA
jgi:hypothetical protein